MNGDISAVSMVRVQIAHMACLIVWMSFYNEFPVKLNLSSYAFPLRKSSYDDKNWTAVDKISHHSYLSSSDEYFGYIIQENKTFESDTEYICNECHSIW